MIANILFLLFVIFCCLVGYTFKSGTKANKWFMRQLCDFQVMMLNVSK